MGWLRMSLRRLRLAPVQTGALALLVGVTALVFAVAPRALQSTGDAILRNELQAAPVDARSLELVQLARIEPGSPDLLANVSARGAGFEAQLPPEVARLVSGTDVVVDTTRFRLEAPTLEDRTLRLRIQPPAAGHIHFVDGAFPTGTTTTLPAGSVTDSTFPPGPVTVVPVALSTASAAALQAQVGQVLLISLDPTDLANRGAQLGLAVEVTGIFSVDEPNDAFWFNDQSLDQPVIRSLSALAQVQDVTALLAPSVYPALLAASDTELEPLRYRWRYSVDVTRLDQAGAPGVITQLRRLQGLFPSPAGPAGPDPVLQGALGQLLEAEQASWQAAQVVLAVVAIGPAVVAAAALALMAVLTGQRRRSSLFLARARGASRAQVWLSLLAEGTLVAVPPAACAAVAAALLVPDGPTQATVIGAATVAVVSVILVLATTVPGLGDRGPSARPGGPARGAGTRRRVLEGLTVVLALGGAWLLLQRGVRGASSTGSLSTVDPFIAAVPALVGLAAGLILRRVYPRLMATAGRLAGARRDLVPVLAMRRATSGGSGGSVLLVLLAAAALGTFASAVLVHLDGAADAIAWQEVGAPFALTSKSGPFPPGFAPQDLPGVTSATAAYLGPATVVDRGAPVQLLALDATAYAALVAGTPADPHLPAGMRVGVSGALPVIASTSLGGGAAGIGVGDDPQLSIAGQPVAVHVVAARDTFPSVPVTADFMVVDRASLEARLGGVTLPTRIWYLAAPDDAASPIRASLAQHAPGVTAAARAEETEALRDQPLVGGIAGGVTGAALVAGAYAALAVIIALILAGAARASEVAYLRLLGLTRRQVVGLVVVEHGPTVVVAFVAGIALGLGLFLVLRPGLGLDAVVGSDIAVPLQVEPAHLMVLLLGSVAIVAAGIAAGTAAQRHATPVAAVRGSAE